MSWPNSSLLSKENANFAGLQHSDFCFCRPNGQELEKIIKLWEEGVVKPVVQAVMPLEDGAKAFEMLADGHTKGKIVLKVAG